MSKWLYIIIGIVVILLVFPIALLLIVDGQAEETWTTTPLHEAAQGGHLDSVKRLIGEGLDVNARDKHGKTPLHLAAENGHSGTTAALIAKGADANIVDVYKRTALFYAQQNGHNGTAENLIPVTTSSDNTVLVEKIGSREKPRGQILKPTLKYKDLASFERTIGQPGCLLTSEHVLFFAPKIYEAEAKIILPYLVNAY